MYIDTHAHLYHARFGEDREDVIARARAAGVTRVVLPAIDVASIHAAFDLCDRHPGLYAMSALHPSDVKDATDADFEAVARLCDDPRVVAVGESGLDYYWDRSFDEKQRDYLRRHARLALEKDLPLILHTRDKRGRDEVFADTLAILRAVRAESEAPERMRGIFHCFGGDAGVAAAVVDLGFHVGLGGTYTFKNGGVPEAVADVPLERIVLETDAPFLAPEPHRGKRNEPAYLPLVAARLAADRGLPVEELARITTDNAVRLFRLPAGG